MRYVARMSDRNYVLGTHDAEIERLGLQHRVWRARALDAWQRARIGPGQTVIDVGAGPGYAAIDLAEITGNSGHIIAIERSRRFLDVLEARVRHRGLSNVSTIETDVVESGFGDGIADAAWCRWVLSFVREPRAVVGHVARALKPGGVAVFHEYLDYRAWRLAPRSPAFERFVDAVIESVRLDGGFMDSGLALPTELAHSGFDIVSTRPMVEIAAPGTPFWRWPASFAAIYPERLVAAEQLTRREAVDAQTALASAEADLLSLMVTPILIEVIARKRG